MGTNDFYQKLYDHFNKCGQTKPSSMSSWHSTHKYNRLCSVMTVEGYRHTTHPIDGFIESSSLALYLVYAVGGTYRTYISSHRYHTKGSSILAKFRFLTVAWRNFRFGMTQIYMNSITFIVIICVRIRLYYVIVNWTRKQLNRIFLSKA